MLIFIGLSILTGKRTRHTKTDREEMTDSIRHVIGEPDATAPVPNGPDVNFRAARPPEGQVHAPTRSNQPSSEITSI